MKFPTRHATFDFETYSAAGFTWEPAAQKWRPPPGGRVKGLETVGAPAYSEHPTTEILTLSYRLPGAPKQRWRPGDPTPQALFDYLAAGGVIEAHNAMFEWLIWNNVAIPRHGFPAFNQQQLRCSMAKARVAGFPGGLGPLSQVLRLPTPKDEDGKRLLKKFSFPRDPTKTDPRTRIAPTDDPADFERLREYCDTDIDAEDGASEALPPLTDDELTFWFIDQEINYRGMAIDRTGVRNCIAIIEQAAECYGEECRTITGGLNPTQGEAVRGWLAAQDVHLSSMDKEAVDNALSRTSLPPECRRVLEIRQLLSSGSVKKLYAMENQACRDDRLRDLLVHHAARTGRPTGSGPQPLNLPREGPAVKWCTVCGEVFRHDALRCPWCDALAPGKVSKWSHAAVERTLALAETRSLDVLEHYLGDALSCIAGSLRGLFVAKPGYELIASDYSAIEAVVLARLAGEQWRVDAFKARQPIYLVGASKITGKPLEYYLQYHSEHGEHHPDRQRIGKVSELACGFGGWINSFRAFGSTEEDSWIKEKILAWRKASPAIVEFWGGQYRGAPWDYDSRQEYFGVEGAAVQAVLDPGTVSNFRGIDFFMRGEALVIRLLSGRELTYNQARLMPAQRQWSWVGELSLSYMTWNTNPKYGAHGWVPMETYGGRLTENIVQATAHDIQRYGIRLLRAAGYPVVLHVYDENVAEIPDGSGSIEQFEALMQTMPPWAIDWPIYATGGWRGHRYRKG